MPVHQHWQSEDDKRSLVEVNPIKGQIDDISIPNFDNGVEWNFIGYYNSLRTGPFNLC